MGAALGGTELAKKWLYENVSNDLLDQVNIVSRPDDMKDDLPNILWVHDLPADMPFLADRSAKNRFAGIVFVSSWQQTVFFMNMNVMYSESTIIRNAIYPIKEEEKLDDGKIRLIYHPTPHRGLELLIPVFSDLCNKYPNLHLDVFSNFDLYNRPESNKSFESLYETCRSHPNITYHGTQSNDTVREALAQAHIFAYPCIWRETSCISAMEAMSARCLIVAPEYAALPETLSNFNISYNWTERPVEHMHAFAAALERAIAGLEDKCIADLLDMQKSYADTFYSWSLRGLQWESYLRSIVNNPRPRLNSGGLQWN